MVEKKVKIGIVGFGKRGKTHLRSYSSIPEVSIEGICELENVNTGKIPRYTDYLEMIKSGNLDAISICLPTYLHYKTAVACLNQGVNVILEKPMVLSVRDANQLFQLARSKGKILIAGYNLRYDYQIQKIKSILSSGELGQVLMVRARQAHNWSGGKPFGWLLDKSKSGGGTIIDNAGHYLNLLEFLIGKIAEIHAFSNNLSFKKGVEDNAVISLKFNKGAIGVIESSWGDASGRNNQLVIWGTKGVLELTEKNEKTAFTVKRYTRDKDAWNRLVVENLYIPKGIEQLGKKVSRDNSKTLAEDSTIAMLQHFIRSIKKPRVNVSLENDDLRTIKLVNAAYASLKQKRVVKV